MKIKSQITNHKSQIISIALISASIFSACSLQAAVTMTFDTAPSGDIGSFALGSTYQENGIQAVSHSSYACFKDMLWNDYNAHIGRTPTTPLYFHGADQYIEFSLVGGGTFNLNSLELVGNDTNPRWVFTSKTGGTERLIGTSTSLTVETFSGPDFTDISWFRVSTHWGSATELDNITVTAVPEPSTLIAGVLLCLPFGVTGMRWMRNRNKA